MGERHAAPRGRAGQPVHLARPARPLPQAKGRTNDPEERDPGLARERTSLARTRTAISFAALGGVVLKANVVTGLIILAIAPVIWRLGSVTGDGADQTGPSATGPVRLLLITASIVLITLLCLAIAIFGMAEPGALRTPSR